MLINVSVASPDPDPDPNPRGGGQLLNPNECNSTLTNGTNKIYPYPCIDVNDRGHRFRSGSPLTNYPHACVVCILADLHLVVSAREEELVYAWILAYEVREGFCDQKIQKQGPNAALSGAPREFYWFRSIYI